MKILPFDDLVCTRPRLGVGTLGLTMATVSLLTASGCGMASRGDFGAGAEAADSNASGGVGPSSGGTSGGDDGADPGGDDSTGDTGGADTGGEQGTTGEVDACDDLEPVTLYLSPDDSNSMSSPVQAREAVLGGWSSLSAVTIRTWEFFNYYSFDYPPAEPGGITVTPSLFREPEAPAGEYLLQIGVASPSISNDARAPLDITLVLDTSGSMQGHPIEMLKESCRAIAASLREGDIVSMVTWDTSNAVVLGGHTVSGPDDPTLLQRIEAIQAGGGTDLHGGLVAGYELASQVYKADRINRIVLVSDGGANVGVTDIDLIAEHAGGNDEDGIYMVGVGVGDASTYHDALMDAVTDAGKGASVFVASEDEAWTVFGERFVNALDVAARDVQVRLDLPPGFEIVQFSGEEYSSDPTEIEPQHLSPNDAMVFHQRISTCAPELVTEDAELTVTTRYKDAHTFEPKEVSKTVTFGELLDGDSTQLLEGAAIFAYAEALKAYREASPADREATLTDAFDALARAEEALPEDADLAEIRSVLEAL